MLKHRILALLTATLLVITAAAQDVSISSAADRLVRLQQLVGIGKSKSGLLSRPIQSNATNGQYDSVFASLQRTKVLISKGRRLELGILPVTLVQQYVTHHPYAQNDGPLIPAKGYQSLVSAGVYGKLGPLSFQLKPEWVRSGNPNYSRTANFGSTSLGGYSKIFGGQSFVRLSGGPVSLSISTENMWWGPGLFHSLLMTNQAPGFPHLKLHSNRPIKTPIGYFEWSLIGARLTSDSIIPFENEYYQNGGFQVPRRYMNGYVVSYQPHVLKGLTFGFARAIQQYESEVKKSTEQPIKKYLPVLLKAVKKENAADDDQKQTDQLASAFFRWLWQRSKAELYGEYGFNDYKANTRDYVMNFSHAAAYLVGFQKGFVLRDSSILNAGFEVLQMSQSADRYVRTAGNWYIHGGIIEGYTYQNQVMGAVFASNVQTLHLGLQKGKVRNALRLQRYQRDPERFFTRWNDVVMGLNHSRPYKDFFFDGQIDFIYSRHYGWDVSRNPLQVFAKVGVHYYFHD